jgi:hypothetical protein
VAFLHAKTDHLQFGFFGGSGLSDPEGLLKADGKYIRHIKVYAMDDIDGQKRFWKGAWSTVLGAFSIFCLLTASGSFLVGSPLPIWIRMGFSDATVSAKILIFEEDRSSSILEH